MNFISTKEAADKWNISQRRVIRLASEGRIRGVRLFGKSWMIPVDAAKPSDGRTKNAAKQDSAPSFRFPFYMNDDEDCFFPPLSKDEKQLRNAQMDFFACRFEQAKMSFEALRNHDNIYIRTTSLFFLCYLSIGCYKGAEFNGYYSLFNKALSEDFPHRQEMLLLRPYLLAYILLYKSAEEAFNIDVEYIYSPSVYPLMAVLSASIKGNLGSPETVRALLGVYEVISRQLEEDNHVYEAQMLHIQLFWNYHEEANEAAMLYHLRKSLDIAYRYELLYPVADAFVYYADIFNKVLKDYPEDFSDKISRLGNQIHKSFSVFMCKYQITDMYAQLSKPEYQYVVYALHGYTNKEIAEILHISIRTVANRYAEIYDKLDVKSKHELIDKYVSWSCKKDMECCFQI